MTETTADLLQQLEIFDPTAIGRQVRPGIKSLAFRLPARPDPEMLFTETGVNPYDGIGEIRRGCEKHIVNRMGWLIHAVVDHVTAQIGPAHLHFSAYGIHTDSIAQVVKLAERGRVLSCRAMLEPRVVTCGWGDAAKSLLQCGPGSAVALVGCHSKVYALANEERAVTIVSSSNFTERPDTEASVLTDNRELYDFHVSQIEAGIAIGTPIQEAVP